jgi:hypothetical protein
METTVLNRIRLIQFHILMEFLKSFGINVEARSMEIGALLTDLLDDDTTPVTSIKALRTFGNDVLYIDHINEYPAAVQTAVFEGLRSAGASFKKLVSDASLEVDLCTREPIGLLEAKRMRDILRSMKAA